MLASEVWFRTGPVAAALIVVCFPHAGGGVTGYLRFGRGMPAGVTLCVARLPGRPPRQTEAMPTSLIELAGEAATAIEILGPAPVCLYGHSFGAMAAYEVARELTRRRRAPRALIVSGHDAPHVFRPSGLHEASDVRLVEALREYGGTAETVAADPEFTKVFLPPVRADLTLLARHHHDPSGVLDCAVMVIDGRDDSTTTTDGVAAWADLTSGACTLHEVSGRHFFPWQGPELARLLHAQAELLAAH